ncbi:MAG: hypothetical protein K2K96_13060 [Lachnospiraceae bacterium]|nr:hypothetical protein [Lachnospiraceae bacterium]
MKKSVVLSVAVGLSMAMLAGCGEKYGYEDADYYTLNKCDASREELVDVCVGGPWSYDDEFSTDEKDMYLDHEDDGFIYISNEALEPLYSYAAAYVSGKSVASSDKAYFEEMGFLHYDCDFEVIGSAFDGSDLILAEESYSYDNGGKEVDMECTYLLIRYSDDGLIEFLTVDFYNMDTDDWTDEDFEELARNLFGK